MSYDNIVETNVTDDEQIEVAKPSTPLRIKEPVPELRLSCGGFYGGLSCGGSGGIYGGSKPEIAPTKVKKPRSEKQIAAFKKAREALAKKVRTPKVGIEIIAEPPNQTQEESFKEIEPPLWFRNFVQTQIKEKAKKLRKYSIPPSDVKPTPPSQAPITYPSTPSLPPKPTFASRPSLPLRFPNFKRRF